MNVPTGGVGLYLSDQRFLGQGSVKLHGLVQLILGVGFVPQKLLNQGKLGPRSLSDYQFRKFKVVITHSNMRQSLTSTGQGVVSLEHKRAACPYIVAEIGVLRQAARQDENLPRSGLVQSLD